MYPYIPQFSYSAVAEQFHSFHRRKEDIWSIQLKYVHAPDYEF